MLRAAGRAQWAVRDLAAAARDARACPQGAETRAELYGPRGRRFSQLPSIPPPLEQRYESFAKLLREAIGDVIDARPACLSAGAHLAYIVDYRLGQVGRQCGKPAWTRPRFALTWDGAEQALKAMVQCGPGAFRRGVCKECP